MKKTKSNIQELNAAEVENLQLSVYNRAINNDHVARLSTAMSNNFSSFGPITVSDRGVIIDGAHRRLAFLNAVKKGFIPADSTLKVMYISVSPEEERKLIQTTNSNSKNWTMTDYVRSNIAAGSDSLRRLVEWAEKKELCINDRRNNDRIKYSFASTFIMGRRQDDALRQGTLEITDEQLAVADEIHDEINELRQILGWSIPAVRYDHWAQVWHEMRKLHTFKEWKAEIKLQKKALQNQIPYTIRGFEQFLGSLDSSINRRHMRKNS